MAANRKNVLSSLAVYAGDSEPEAESEGEPEDEIGGLVSRAYGQDDISRIEEDGSNKEDDEDTSQSVKYLNSGLDMRTWTQQAPPMQPFSLAKEEEESETENQESGEPKELSELEKRDPQELVASFSERVRNMSPDDIKIPPEPPGRCSNHLQEKIQKLYEKKLKEGTDMNRIIQKKKEFRNPSIYEKLIQFCSIDELGTNYPKDMFDPHGWSEDSYYESLAKAQKIEMDKLEKAKKERTKIEFVTGTKKGTTTSATTGTTSTTTTSTADAQKRKSKWDSAIPMTTIAQPTILTTTATLPAVVTVTTSASGSKTTVISAVGTIAKKAKQ
ncbi:SAP30-binding protein isoform X1 [Xenopus laevis]|uniref:SAP30-binding protein isoform X1 n=1 Tax=Xenopus laevis TaxID=8355 RepID=A0A8J0U2T9_XENLA|nr:SAP30-binding protein isoform X1 [Xenopus laevis]